MPYNYDNGSQRWRDTDTGRFVSENIVTNEMQSHMTATYNTLEGLTNQLYNGQINLQQWQVSVASQLKDAHLAQAMFGAGGQANMTQANYGRVGGTLASEYRFLANFANDIANGNVSQAQAVARIRQYGNATQQSYWREYAQSTDGLVNWVLAAVEHCPDCVALASGSPYRVQDLPTVPGAGVTRCRGNCRCRLERIN